MMNMTRLMMILFRHNRTVSYADLNQKEAPRSKAALERLVMLLDIQPAFHIGRLTWCKAQQSRPSYRTRQGGRR
jgi:hypothetical protein